MLVHVYDQDGDRRIARAEFDPDKPAETLKLHPYAIRGCVELYVIDHEEAKNWETHVKLELIKARNIGHFDEKGSYWPHAHAEGYPHE